MNLKQGIVDAHLLSKSSLHKQILLKLRVQLRWVTLWRVFYEADLAYTLWKYESSLFRWTQIKRWIWWKRKAHILFMNAHKKSHVSLNEKTFPSDIDRLCRCVCSVYLWFVHVGVWASTYCTRLYSALRSQYNRSGKVFLFPLRFNENQAKGKVSLLMNRHQAITQLTPSNNSAK